MCKGGTNSGFVGCVTDSQCPGGVCNATDTCDFGVYCQGGANNGTMCASDSACPGGSCVTSRFRPCYPDNGVIGTYCFGGTNDGIVCSVASECPSGFCGGGSVTAMGGHGEPDLVNARISVQMASLFCIGPTSAGSINAVAGLPSLGRMTMTGVMQGLAPASAGQLHGGSVTGGRF